MGRSMLKLKFMANIVIRIAYLRVMSKSDNGPPAHSYFSGHIRQKDASTDHIYYFKCLCLSNGGLFHQYSNRLLVEI